MALLLIPALLLLAGARLKVCREGELGALPVDAERIAPAKGMKPDDAFILVGESDLAKRPGVTAEGLGSGGILIRQTHVGHSARYGSQGNTLHDNEREREALPLRFARLAGMW